MVKIRSKRGNRARRGRENTLGQAVGEDGVHRRGASNPAQRARKRSPVTVPSSVTLPLAFGRERISQPPVGNDEAGKGGICLYLSS